MSNAYSQSCYEKYMAGSARKFWNKFFLWQPKLLKINYLDTILILSLIGSFLKLRKTFEPNFDDERGNKKLFTNCVKAKQFAMQFKSAHNFNEESNSSILNQVLQDFECIVIQEKIFEIFWGANIKEVTITKKKEEPLVETDILRINTFKNSSL